MEFKVHKINVSPLDGINIENVGKVALGQPKSIIQKILGQASDSSNLKQLYFNNYELRIDFDDNNNAEFIEFIQGPFPEKTELSLYGINPFQIGADNLIALLSEKNMGETDDSEADYSFAFLNTSIGVWRQFTEEDVQEEIKQMQESNEYEENKDWLNED